MRLFFHPQRGAFVSPVAINPACGRYRGGPDSAWRELEGVTATQRPDGGWDLRGRLPAGFLRGDPARQVYGMGGPALVFGPLEKVCRACRKQFSFSAAEQRHWYEELGFFIDSTAVRCAPCRAGTRKREQARRAWELALRSASATPSASTHLSVAEAALALLELGLRAPIDVALGHCTRATRLGGGAEVERVRAALRKRL